MRKPPLLVVLTGGPCAGKSTVLQFLRNELTQAGYKVFSIAETATEVHATGIDLGTNKQSFLQTCILSLQLLKEDTVFAMANFHTASRSVVLLDRGAVDAEAYMSADSFRFVAGSQEKSVFELLHRYDAVLHLRSTAYDMPDIYTRSNNDARSESIKDAKVLDERTLNAWIGTPHLRVFTNAEGLHEKQQRVLGEVLNLLSEQPLEIESKWLVDAESARRFLKSPGQFKKTHLGAVKVISTPFEQIYLKDGSRLRKRGTGEDQRYYHTVKQEVSPGVNTEVEVELGFEDYNLMAINKAHPNARRIEKVRHMFVWNNRYWELDEFKTIGTKLKTSGTEFFMLETELRPDESHHLGQKSLETPPFLRMLRDVTHDSSFKNKNMALNGLPSLT